MAQQNDFDFRAFGALTDRIPAGLQVFLAQQLLTNALWSFDRYDNPRSGDVRTILADIKDLRAGLKADAAERAASKE